MGIKTKKLFAIPVMLLALKGVSYGYIDAGIEFSGFSIFKSFAAIKCPLCAKALVTSPSFFSQEQQKALTLQFDWGLQQQYHKKQSTKSTKK